MLFPFSALPFLFALFHYTVAGARCQSACESLRRILPRGSVARTYSPGAYWAQQASEINAACYATPRSPRQVADVLFASRNYGCNLAIRGGGHSDVPGANNIEGGIVLDLSAFNEITIDAQKSVVRVGAGQNWGSVYKELDTRNLTTTGGRESSVGVAGLLLGGGISYFSGTKGFACDRVQAFEVVLANGSSVTVTRDSKYSDLFRALKGGSNNFAVVTHFHLDIYPYSQIWGGLTVYNDTPAVTEAITNAFASVSVNQPSAPHAHMFTAIGYSPAISAFHWSSGQQYTLPDASPAIFAPFRNATLTSAASLTTQRLTNHTDLADELDATQPPGFRNQFTTATYAVDAALQRRIAAILREEVRTAVPRMSTMDGFAPGVSFQALTKNMLEAQFREGSRGEEEGNVLGLEAREAPLMIVGFMWQWKEREDDAVVRRGIANVLERSTQEARSRGLWNEFVYINYAAPGQEPVRGYGERNGRFLREVSRRWDPEGFFQTRVPGGFKLA